MGCPVVGLRMRRLSSSSPGCLKSNMFNSAGIAIGRVGVYQSA
jgi:hypothetical protein